jgi:hypothetical protein
MTRLVLAAIILLSCLLTIRWAFLIPIFQNPDENSHFDYAVSIYSAGRLLNVREPPSDWNGPGLQTGVEWERVTHVFTKYLVEKMDFVRMKYYWDRKVPAGYGTRDYFRVLDAGAPGPAPPPRENPWLVRGYPAGYYAAAALWMRLTAPNTPSRLFFSARLFSVPLLAVSLLLCYGVLVKLGLGRWQALALTACVAFFPLTTFVSAAVQPDNLSLPLVLLSVYLALGRRLRLLGLSLALLWWTKYHVGLAATLAAAGYLWSEGVSLKRIAAALATPIAPALAVQTWVGWGAPPANNFLLTRTPLHGIWAAFRDYYLGGDAFRSWFGIFGWMDTSLTIRDDRVQGVVFTLEVLVTLALLALTAFALARAAGRVRLLLADPLLTFHLLFVAGLFALYVVTDNSFFAQGRHFYPAIVSGFYVGTVYAPKALTGRPGRLLSWGLICLTLAYDVLAQMYAWQTIRVRYYG